VLKKNSGRNALLTITRLIDCIARAPASSPNSAKLRIAKTEKVK